MLLKCTHVKGGISILNCNTICFLFISGVVIAGSFKLNAIHNSSKSSKGNKMVTCLWNQIASSIRNRSLFEVVEYEEEKWKMVQVYIQETSRTMIEITLNAKKIPIFKNLLYN